MPSVGLEPATLATERSRIYTADGTVTAISNLLNIDTDFSLTTNMSHFIHSLSS